MSACVLGPPTVPPPIFGVPLQGSCESRLPWVRARQMTPRRSALAMRPCVRARREPGTSCPAFLAACSTAAQPPRTITIGERDHRPVGLRAIKGPFGFSRVSVAPSPVRSGYLLPNPSAVRGEGVRHLLHRVCQCLEMSTADAQAVETSCAMESPAPRIRVL